MKEQSSSFTKLSWRRGGWWLASTNEGSSQMNAQKIRSHHRNHPVRRPHRRLRRRRQRGTRRRSRPRPSPQRPSCRRASEPSNIDPAEFTTTDRQSLPAVRAGQPLGLRGDRGRRTRPEGRRRGHGRDEDDRERRRGSRRPRHGDRRRRARRDHRRLVRPGLRGQRLVSRRGYRRLRERQSGVAEAVRSRRASTAPTRES